MSGLQNFLAPFSHLLFANRNIVIVLLCAGLFGVALDALIHRWRATRLEHDLSTARSGASNPTGRRYVTAQAVEEAPPESGGLPPVKGGRTYARNLGSALHKAGMSGPQIYSPPTPPGWAPNTNPMQPAPPQPGMAPPYATPNVPWAAPAPPPQAAPWGYPAGAGRGMPGQLPAPAPYYQPSAPPPQPQPQPQPTGMPQPQAPGLYALPPPAPFGQPTIPAPTSGPGTPSFAPPNAPGPPAGAPLYQPPTPGPVGEPPGPDGGRRGKPKRRRFNFNVLENLEKMVQAKPSEAAPSTGWTPPVKPPAAQVAPPSTPTAAEPTSPAKPSEVESLPLQFGAPAANDAAEATAAVADTEPVAAEPPAAREEEGEETPAADEPEAAQPEAYREPEQVIEPEPHPEPEPEPEPKVEPRTSMRSMLFGEEAGPSSDTEPKAPEPASPVVEPDASASIWPSYPWTRDPDTTDTEPDTAVPQPSSTDEPTIETAPEPLAESTSTSFDPWRSTSDSDEPIAATVASESAEASVEVSEAPVAVDGDGSSAGVIVLIEDDQTAASYYATLFRGNGYRVEVANDGVSGVDLCARLQPQLILLDVMMPRQNGILVLQTLRASDETKTTPVVVMSNFSEPTLIKRAIQLGALEYVIKTQVEGPALLNALPRWMKREKAFAAA